MMRRARWTTLDRIVRVERGRGARRSATSRTRWPSSTRHFPRFPVLPGVLILGSLGELARELLEQSDRQRWRLRRRRAACGFRHFVQPGDQMELAVELKERRRRPRPRSAARSRSTASVVIARPQAARGARRGLTDEARRDHRASGSCTPLGDGTEETWAGAPRRAAARRADPRRSTPSSLAHAARRRDRASFDAATTSTNRRVRAHDDPQRPARDGRRDAGRAGRRARAARGRRDGASALFVGGNKEISNPDALLEAVRGRARRGRHGRHARASASWRYGSVHPLFFIEGLQGGVALLHLRGVRPARAPTPTSPAPPRPARSRSARGFRAHPARRGRRGDRGRLRRRRSPGGTWRSSTRSGVLTGRNELGAARLPPVRPRPRRHGARRGRGVPRARGARGGARARRARSTPRSPASAARYDTRQLLTPDPDGRPLAARRSTRALARGRRRAGRGRLRRGPRQRHARSATPARRARCARPSATATARSPSSVKPATGHLVGGGRRAERRPWPRWRSQHRPCRPTLEPRDIPTPTCDARLGAERGARGCACDAGARAGPRPRRPERRARPAAAQFA